MTLSDAQGNIVNVNPAYCALFGASREQWVGKPLPLLTTGASARQALEHYRILYATEKISPPLETSFRQPNGDERLIQFQFYLAPRHPADRTILAIIRDQTARQRSELELAQYIRGLRVINTISNSMAQPLDLPTFLQAALDLVMELAQIPIGIIHLFGEENPNGLPVAHRGLTPAQIDHIQSIHPDHLPFTSNQFFKDAPMRGPIRDLNFDSILDPRCVFVAIPIKAKSKFLGMLTLISADAPAINHVDQTLLMTIGCQIGVALENARLAERAAEINTLRQVDQLRAELIANVSHELRTPLGLIKAFCTTLMAKDVAFDRAMRREILEDIDRETDKLNRIVANLLDLSQLQNHRLQLEKSALDLGALIATVIAQMKIDQTKHRVVCNRRDQPITLMADSQRLEQVLRNLLGNAIKYSPAGGNITLDYRRQSDQVVVSIRDQGIGIPAAELEKIFERFYRVKSEQSQPIGGIGLGLAVSRGIVQAHGGTIWATSTPGQGSVFYFTLPLLEASPEWGAAA